MAVGTMLTVEAVLSADDVAADRTGRQPQFRLIEARLGQGDRIIGRAKHRQQHGGHLPLLIHGEPLLRGLHHVGAKRRGGSGTSADGYQQQPGRRGQQNDVVASLDHDGCWVRCRSPMPEPRAFRRP